MKYSEYLFKRFPPFIKEFIYSHSWEDLRDIQLAAAQYIFESENNLLLTSSTASGKTEAVFFPILTELIENPTDGISVLYIAPLKSLINDQFSRIEELLDESGIRVTHWHGDVSQAHKRKLLDDPQGILQITPESLEAMLMNRHSDIKRIFGNLRFVIIDEIHMLMGTDRGNQILCQLARIENIIGFSPRRIGLSATVGEANSVAEWLSEGSGRKTDIPKLEKGKIRWRLGMEHFYISGDEDSQPSKKQAALDAGYEYIYDYVKKKKSLVFSNSREETEYACANLKQIADKRREPDVFLIHHGSLSASLREEAEKKMKDSDIHAVTCATVTMELGIDIGQLDQILQINSPRSISSFLQRLGRSGRRGQPPEMMFVFREEAHLPDAHLPEIIPWDLVCAIAIVQLYIEERFIEPPVQKIKPYSLLFHQTLSVLASFGELTPRELAEKILSFSTFKHITKEEYRTLLVSMLNNGVLEMTDERGLIVGTRAEKMLNSYKFYAVFSDSEDFTVRHESEEIGTITFAPPEGGRFALAGQVWEVLELDMPRKLVYVKRVKGKMAASWPGRHCEIHTKILERMKRVLFEDTVYPYLSQNAYSRLTSARSTARKSGILDKSIVYLGEDTWAIFPWLGTRSFKAFVRMISSLSEELGITSVESVESYFITVKMEYGNDIDLIKSLVSKFQFCENANCLVSDREMLNFEKYDEFIPGELLRSAFSSDRLDINEAKKRIFEINKEYF